MTENLINRWDRPGPKRILTIDGGGVRGLIAIQFLKSIEKKVCNQDTCANLSEYFDLIAGTSTGSIIASLLSLGKSVGEIEDLYIQFASKVFKKRWVGSLFGGSISSRFSKSNFRRFLSDLFHDTSLGSDTIRTGLMVVARRVDTSSTWVLHNNPRSKFYRGMDQEFVSNSDILLSNIILASCSAPTYFKPEKIRIATQKNGSDLYGTFIDGGCSPHNNPSLLAYQLVTMNGYGYSWPDGPDNMEVVSVGTGRVKTTFDESGLKPAALFAVQALKGLMDGCALEVEKIMQWMSVGRQQRVIDSEIGDLADDFLGGNARFKYERHNVDLDQATISQALGRQISPRETAAIQRLDKTSNLRDYITIGLSLGNELMRS